MTQKELMNQILALYEIHFLDIETRAIEIQVAHARIDLQKHWLEHFVEELTGVIPEDDRAQLAARMAADKSADEIARINSRRDFTLDQQAARIARMRELIESMPDE